MPRRRETPAQRTARLHRRAMARKRAAQNDPERVTGPLTPRSLEREAGAAERLRFGDEDRLLRGEYGASQEHARRGAAWFQDYQNQIRQAEERSRAYSQGQQDAQNQLAAQSFQQDTQRSQQLNQQAQADAQRRGASVDPGLAQTAELAAQSRRTSSQQQANLTGTLGANQGTYLAQRGIAAAGQGLQFQQDEARRGQGVQRRQRDLGREKGDFRVAYRQRAREDERRYGLELSAFGQNVVEAAQDAADDRSRARDRTRDNRRQDEQFDRGQEQKDEDQRLAEQREDRLSQPKPKDKKPRKATARSLKGREAILSARRQYGRFGGDANKYRRSAARNNVSPVIAEAGRQLATQGYVGPNTIRRLREIGVVIPRAWSRQRTSAFPNPPPEQR